MRKIKLILAIVSLLFCVDAFAAQQFMNHGTGTYWGQIGTLGQKPTYQQIDENFTELYSWGDHSLAGYEDSLTCAEGQIKKWSIADEWECAVDEGDAANLSTTTTATTVTIESSNGTDALISSATGSDAGILTASDKTNIDNNTTHKTSDGSDHTFIDQDVTSGASPTFSGINISDVLYPNVEVEPSKIIGSPTILTDYRSVFNHIWSSGVTDGCTLTDNGNGTVNISAGTALLRSSASEHADLIVVDVQAQNNIALVDNSVNYLVLSYNGGSVTWLAVTSTTEFNCLDICLAYVAVREGNDISHVSMIGQNIDANTKYRRKSFSSSKFIFDTNSSILSSSGLYVKVTSGGTWISFEHVIHDAFDTSGTDTYALYYTADNGSSWTKVSGQTTINTNYYNPPDTGYVELGVAKYAKYCVYLINNTPSSLAIIPSNNQFSSELDAINAPHPAYLPPIIDGLGIFLGSFVAQKGDTSLVLVPRETDTVSAGAPTSHEGLSDLYGGASNDHYHLTSAQHTDLTDSGDSTLHYHASDREYTATVPTYSDDPCVMGQWAWDDATNYQYFCASVSPSHWKYRDQNGVVVDWNNPAP